MIRQLLLDPDTRSEAGPKIKEFMKYLSDLKKGKSEPPAAPPLSPGESAADSSASSLSAEWDRQWSKLEPLYLNTLQGQVGKSADDLRKVMNFAVGKADEGAHKTALKALGKLKELLASVAGGTATADSTTATSEEPVADWGQASSVWRDASDTVDSQITKLQNVLKQSGDDELEDIANLGLNALTGNFKVSLMTAIREIDTGTSEARAKAARKALGIISEFRRHVTNSEMIMAVDNNPFGVELTIGSTLLGAFSKLENALQPVIAG